jgi:hypothetical protein
MLFPEEFLSEPIFTDEETPLYIKQEITSIKKEDFSEEFEGIRPVEHSVSLGFRGNSLPLSSGVIRQIEREYNEDLIIFHDGSKIPFHLHLKKCIEQSCDTSVFPSILRDHIIRRIAQERELKEIEAKYLLLDKSISLSNPGESSCS